MSCRRRVRFRLCGVIIAASAIGIPAMSGCHHARRATSPVPTAPRVEPNAVGETLAPSPRLIIGRIIAVDSAQRFAFVELASDAPAPAMANGADLIARTLDLRETAHLQVSRYVRGRTLGTKVIGGQPSPGDEVVWLAP